MASRVVSVYMAASLWLGFLGFFAHSLSGVFGVGKSTNLSKSLIKIELTCLTQI